MTTLADSKEPTARCLDLTRLVSRVGRGAWTGVDRVEAAYLNHLLLLETPLFALVRTRRNFTLLDHSGTKQLAERLHGCRPWGSPDWRARSRLRATKTRMAAESDLRRLGLDHTGRRSLASLLTRHLPDGCAYLNVGHSNLRDHVFLALRQVRDMHLSVLVHDMIPLDFPDFQRDGTVTSFAAKMRAVSRHADLVIYNSRQSQISGAAHFGCMGRVPDSVVAHLGLDVPTVAGAVPSHLAHNRPYFVTVGTIEPRKNHALLLDVWAQMAKTRAASDMPTLLIIGKRGWKNEKLFARLDAQPAHVRELPDLSDAEMAALVAGAQGLLFPSFAEGFGLPPCEAAALGTPVVVHDLPVYREILGEYPIYANVADIYLWEQIVTELAARPATPVRGCDLILPSWDAHFNLVLKMT